MLLNVSRQSRWILKQRCDADLEVYKFSLPFGSYIETCTSFYVFSRPTWLADWIGYWTPIKLPRCLSASHCWTPPPLHHSLSTLSAMSVHLGLAQICPLWQALVPFLNDAKFETFVTLMSWHDGRRHCLIKMRRNDRKCDRKRLLDVIYMGVGG